MGSIDALADEWQRSSVLRSRWPYFAGRTLGSRQRLRFRSGLTIPQNQLSNRVRRKLVYFAYLGAPLTLDAPGDSYSWKIDTGLGIISSPTGLRFHLDSFDPYILAETYLAHIHRPEVSLRGKVVFDGGAYIGDSALYFAELGAEVYAFEPDSANHASMVENLRLNPALAVRIHPFQCALGIDGKVPFQSGLGSASRVDGQSKEAVESWSLQRALREAGVDRACLLKTDCKGAEFELVRQPRLSAFEELAIEYFADGRSNTIEKLCAGIQAAGFEIRDTRKHSGDGLSIEVTGQIRASRPASPP